MQTPQGIDQRPPSPHRRREHRRHEWLAIYIPMLLGLVAVAALVVGMWRGGVGTPSLWSDISLIFLLAFVIGMAAILLVLIVAAAVGLVYAIRWLPLPAQRGRSLAARMDGAVRKGATLTIRPIVLPKASWAALLAGIRTLTSIFRSPGRGLP